MARVVNRETCHVIDLANTPDYPPEHWLINPVMPEGVPYRYLKVVGDAVVEMSAEEKAAVDNPPETMAERHLREKREGVTLQRGWVLSFEDEKRVKMQELLTTINQIGQSLPGVAFWEVDGTRHDTTVSDGLAVINEYIALAFVEQMRQYGEVENG